MNNFDVSQGITNQLKTIIVRGSIREVRVTLPYVSESWISKVRNADIEVVMPAF